MKNKELARLFSQIADLMEILGEDRFRINSYRKASRVIGDLAETIEQIVDSGRLEKIPGVGKSPAAKIGQYLTKGEIELHRELVAKVPRELPGLLEVGGLGPKTVAKLWRQAGITSRAELKDAFQNDPERLTRVEGLGDRKARQIWESVMFLESAGGRIRLGDAERISRELIDVIEQSDGVRRVTAAGSLRRGRETIGDIDLLCEAPKAKAAGIIEGFTGANGVERVLAQGGTKGSVILAGGVQADLRVVPKKSFGSALAYFTGSKNHNVRMRELAIKKGFKLNEYGLFKGDKQIAGSDEEGIYEVLGLAWIPPELREDRGEMATASEGTLPEPVRFEDIRADLHMHTTWSDGDRSVDEMVRACRERGYTCMAVCDHSKSEVQANGLDENRLARQVKEVRAVAKKHEDITVLAGVEVDIFKDGRLDFADDVLAALDFVTASAHSALTMGGKEATQRLVKAIENPYVNCIGHPSGRVIGARPGMELDIEPIARAAAANNVALEINAHHMRLDLRDTHVRAAIEAGAKILINTDAHTIDDLDMMRYGVMTARRGWATAENVINTWAARRIRQWLAETRGP